MLPIFFVLCCAPALGQEGPSPSGLPAATIFSNTLPSASKSNVGDNASAVDEDATLSVTADTPAIPRRLDLDDAFLSKNHDKIVKAGLDIFLPMLQYIGALMAKLAQGDDVPEGAMTQIARQTLKGVLGKGPALAFILSGMNPAAYLIAAVAGGFLNELLLSETSILDQVKVYMDIEFLKRDYRDALINMQTFVNTIGKKSRAISGKKKDKKKQKRRERQLWSNVYKNIDIELVSVRKHVFHPDCYHSLDSDTCTRWRQQGTFRLALVWIPFELQILADCARIAPTKKLRKFYRKELVDVSQIELTLLQKSYEAWKQKTLSQRLVDVDFRNIATVVPGAVVPCWPWEWLVRFGQDCRFMKPSPGTNWTWVKPGDCSADRSAWSHNPFDTRNSVTSHCTGECDRLAKCGVDGRRNRGDFYDYCVNFGKKRRIQQCWDNYKATAIRDFGKHDTADPSPGMDDFVKKLKRLARRGNVRRLQEEAAASPPMPSVASALII